MRQPSSFFQTQQKLSDIVSLAKNEVASFGKTKLAINQNNFDFPSLLFYSIQRLITCLNFTNNLQEELKIKPSLLKVNIEALQENIIALDKLLQKSNQSDFHSEALSITFEIYNILGNLAFCLRSGGGYAYEDNFSYFRSTYFPQLESFIFLVNSSVSAQKKSVEDLPKTYFSKPYF